MADDGPAPKRIGGDVARVRVTLPFARVNPVAQLVERDLEVIAG